MDEEFKIATISILLTIYKKVVWNAKGSRPENNINEAINLLNLTKERLKDARNNVRSQVTRPRW